MREARHLWLRKVQTCTQISLPQDGSNRILQGSLPPSDEAAPKHAVDHTVIVAVAQEHHVAHGDDVSVFGFEHGRPLPNGTERQDPHLRLVDDGVPITLPKVPTLLMVYVPPAMSSGDSLPSLARLARSFT